MGPWVHGQCWPYHGELCAQTTLAKLLINVARSSSYQNAACTAGLKDAWLQVWRLSSRSVTSSVACRAACHVMSVVLDRGLIEFPDITELVDGMVSSADVNGPAVFADSSVTLWSMFISLKERENHGMIHNIGDRVLRWLFTKWSPGRLSRVRYQGKRRSSLPGHISKFSRSSLRLPSCPALPGARYCPTTSLVFRARR